MHFGYKLFYTNYIAQVQIAAGQSFTAFLQSVLQNARQSLAFCMNKSTQPDALVSLRQSQASLLHSGCPLFHWCEKRIHIDIKSFASYPHFLLFSILSYRFFLKNKNWMHITRFVIIHYVSKLLFSYKIAKILNHDSIAMANIPICTIAASVDNLLHPLIKC